MVEPTHPALAVLEAATTCDWTFTEARLAMAEPLLLPDEAAMLLDIVDARRDCRKLAPELFVLDTCEGALTAAARAAYGFVAAETGMTPPIVLEALPASAPTHVRVSAGGLGHVMVGSADAGAPALVHEFAHCVAISGVSFLDEGFATWLEARFDDRAIAIESWPRPTLAALLEMDWQQDPHFEALAAHDADAPYRLAAWMAAALATASGCATLVAAIHALRRRTSATDVAQLIAVRCGVHPDALERDLVAKPVGPLPDAAAILAGGEVTAARAALPMLRAATLHDVPGGCEALVRAALTIGITSFDAEGQLARAEAMAGIRRLAARGEVTPLLTAYALIISSFGAASPIERRATGARAAERFARLIDDDAHDAETLIAAAKAQTYAPAWFLPQAEWRRRLNDLSSDDRFGAAAGRLVVHPRFQPEPQPC